MSTKKGGPLRQLLASKNGEGDFDIIVFASGGKDSSYALYRIVQNAPDPSRVLAVTMENGFLSEGAKENLETLKQRLGFQHRYWSIDQKILFSFYRGLAGHGNPRSVCVGCNILSGRMEYEALSEYKPAFFATGNNSSEYDKFAEWLRKRKIENTGSGDTEFEYRHGIWVYNERVLKEVFGDDSLEYRALSCPEPTLKDETSGCERIRLFDHYKYNVTGILSTLKDLGWSQPVDVIGTETDCTFTQAIAHALIESKGRKAYKLALMVRMDLPRGDRNRALRRLSHYDPDLGKQLLERVGYHRYLNDATNDLLPIR